MRTSIEFADFSLILLQLRMQLRQSLVLLLKHRDLTMETWLILVCLSKKKEGLTMSALADTQGMNMPGVSKNVDKLDKRALVYRLQDSEDQRRVVIVLSDSGRELLEEIDQSLSRAEQILNKKIPKKTREDFITMCNTPESVI